MKHTPEQVNEINKELLEACKLVIDLDNKGYISFCGLHTTRQLIEQAISKATEEET